MKNIYLLILILCSVFLNAQVKYYIDTSDRNHFIRILTYSKDGNYSFEELKSQNGKIEKISSSNGQVKNQEEERELLKNTIPFSAIKTNKPEDFAIYNNKTLRVKNKKTKAESRFRFYGSHLLFEDREYNGFYTARPTHEFLIDNNSKNETFRDYQLRYNFYTLENITLFLLGNKIYVFKINELFRKLFPDSDVSFTDKNFANPNAFLLLDISSKNNPNGENFQGVTEYRGKEILPAKFEKILICADAILAKDKGLWYFYDFYGVKIIDKGFQKILPLQLIVPEYINDKTEVTKKGILQYAILENNEIKIIKDIYKLSKNSEFIGFGNPIQAICGTRTGSYSESLYEIRTKNNTIEINQETYFYNSNFNRDLQGSDNKYITNNKTSFFIKKDFGKIEYLNKTDSINTLYKIPNDRLVHFFKIKKENKEGFYAVSFGYLTDKSNFYASHSNYFGNMSGDMNTIFLFDKLDEYTSDFPLLNLSGDYRDYFHLSLNYESLDSNFYPNTYYKIWNNGKVGLYSPRSIYLGNVNIKYKTLEDIKNRFLRFEDEKGKLGWLSEDGEEFYDL